MDDGNGSDPAPDDPYRGWIPFGDLPNQTLHPDTAEAMLRKFRERDPAYFGIILADVFVGVQLAKKRVH